MIKTDVLLHSAYNPKREGERFAERFAHEWQGLTVNHIVITGACISYCVPYFRQLFPMAQMHVIQYSKHFAQSDVLWNTVSVFDTIPGHDFYSEYETCVADRLCALIPEVDIPFTRFISWKPSEQAFPVLYELVWKGIKKALEKNRAVLTTRAYFTSRWTANAFRFCAHLENVYTFSKGTAPILLIASGPSLETHIDFLHAYGEHFFIIALSSALEVLLHAGIIPDCCVSTDGGYWAKSHLYALSAHPEIPLLLAVEGNVPSDILSRNPIIPLRYGDGLGEALLLCCHIPALKAERNGTVAGTAAMLAYNLSNAPIYAMGLDVCTSQSYTHARPNYLDEADMNHTNRFLPLASLLAEKNKSSVSLDMYADWFASRPSLFTDCFMRITPCIRHIPSIKELDRSVLTDLLKSNYFTDLKKPQCTSVSVPSVAQRRTILHGELRSMMHKYRHNPALLEQISFQEYLKQKKGETIDIYKVESYLKKCARLIHVDKISDIL